MSSIDRPTVEGLLVHESPLPVRQTMDRLEAQVRRSGLLVFARVDHAAGAASVGSPLRPTELLIFGHPQGGTPLMKQAQSIGIDLPLKALVWEDAQGQVWLGYNDVDYLVHRHGVMASPAAAGLSGVLASLIEASIAD